MTVLDTNVISELFSSTRNGKGFVETGVQVVNPWAASTG